MDLFSLPPLITTVATFLAILLATWIVARFAGTFLGRILKSGPPIVLAHARRLVTTFVWLVGSLIALEQIGLRIEIIVLLIGLIGVVLVVANRQALENVASKYFSDFYIPFKVGDTIAIREHTGKVIAVNPISTVLITANQNLISVPNSIMLSEILVNSTPQAWKEIAIPIMIDNNLPLPAFESEILRACSKMRHLFDERFPPILSVKNRGDKTTELVLTLMVNDPDTKDTVVQTINGKVTEIQERMKHGP